MTSPQKVVFLFDVDNTLLDNDRVQNDLRNHLEREFGAETRETATSLSWKSCTLKEWSAERALLSAKADKAKAGAKIAYCKTIGALRDKQDAAKTKLEELKSRRER
jgi:beta-phosphoglucomutase-like phosphatase (HAD superfamily)